MSDTPETNRLRGNYDEDPRLNDIWETMERIERERAIELERSNYYRNQWQTAMSERDEAISRYKALKAGDEAIIKTLMRELNEARRKRDESTTKLQQISSELQMWRDGNILHENHRDELDKLKRERDEARKHWGTESMNAAEFFGKKTKAIAERDEARKQNAKLRDIAERSVWRMVNGACLPHPEQQVAYIKEEGQRLRAELEQIKEGGK
jgi:hypothetical protein